MIALLRTLPEGAVSAQGTDGGLLADQNRRFALARGGAAIERPRSRGADGKTIVTMPYSWLPIRRKRTGTASAEG